MPAASTALTLTEVERQLQEGCAGTPQMPIKKLSGGGAGVAGVAGAASGGAGPEGRAVQMRRPTNRRGKQAPTPPKRTRCVPPHALPAHYTAVQYRVYRVHIVLQLAVLVQLLPGVAVRKRGARAPG